MNPKISVIVPVYNTEKYLDRCIQSILAQTYTDFELLLINDGSTDSSGAICDKYAKQDVRVRVFHKENGGVSSARNKGLDNAQGEWVSFVDSDDWLEIGALESLIKHADADLIIGSIKFHASGTVGNLIEGTTLIDEADLNDLLSKKIDHYSISSPCTKIFKNIIIQDKGIRFNPKLCFGEDSLFVKNYLLFTKSIWCVDALCYHYQDIDEDIYKKYSKSFTPILNYYHEISASYDKLENAKGMKISRCGIVGVVYEIAKICFKQNYYKDRKEILGFLRNIAVRKELCKRNSWNIRIELFLAKLPLGFLLYIYIQIVSIIKKSFK